MIVPFDIDTMGFTVKMFCVKSRYIIVIRPIVVVIIWSLDLHLLLSVPITTKVVSSNQAPAGVYSIKHYAIQFASDLRHVGGFSGYSCFLYQ